MLKQLLRWIALSVSMAVGGYASAALSPDPTGLWYDPAESGWGLSVSQQGDTVFAVLFVYDQANHPVWYVASDLEPLTINPPGGPMVRGTLYRTAGPWFGGTFDPHAVTMTPVGTLSLQFLGPSPQSMQVGYDIDGVTVAKSVQPQTFADGSATLLGTYEGGLRITAKSSPTCDDVSFGPIDTSRAFNFQVLQDASGGPGHVHFIWGTGVDTMCLAIGDYAQKGQLASFTGVLACGPVATLSNANPFQLQLTGLAISTNGFAGAMSAQRDGCTYSGHVGGVRTID
jgi:hypothetical protein